VWDLLQLLIVPLVITSFGLFWTTTQQDVRDMKMADQQAETQQRLEEERAQDAALQDYLETMKTLLLDEGLRAAEPDSSVRALAQAETLSAFSKLDPQRKELALQFLYESSLIEKKSPIVDLNNVSLERIHLTDIDLSGANLSGTNLSDTDLSGTNLSNANLTRTCLADNTGFKNRAKKADLNEANLSDANLTGAYKLEGHLNKGGYYNETIIPNEKLAQQTKTLEGATMPNGQQYRDWLKDNGSQKAD
jgi:uncharacterized protein YjbI with pentapeptide repeats